MDSTIPGFTTDVVVFLWLDVSGHPVSALATHFGVLSSHLELCCPK